MDHGIFVPITLFAMIALIAIVSRALRSHERQKIADVIRVAYEHGQTPAPELLAALADQRRGRPRKDLHIGLLLLAVAVAIVIHGAVNAAMGFPWGLHVVGAAAFPLMIGLAFLVMAYLNRKQP